MPSNSDSAHEHKEIVLRFMELMDTHRFDDLREVLSPDLRLHLGQATLDRDAAESMIREVYKAFPDFTHTVEDVLTADDDRVVVRATDRATHLGAFQGVLPTGRKVVAGQIGVYRIVGGRISEIWEEFDMYGFMQELRTPSEEGTDAAVLSAADAIRRLFNRWAEFEVEGDIDGWASLIAEDVELLPPGEPAVRQKESVRDYAVQFFKLPISAMEPGAQRVIVSQSGDLAVNFGNLRMVLDNPKGPLELDMKCLAVWRKFDGKWLIVANTWSSNRSD